MDISDTPKTHAAVERMSVNHTRAWPKVVEWEVAAEFELQVLALQAQLVQVTAERDAARIKLAEIAGAPTKGWLLKGSRMFQDGLERTEAHADRTLSTRKDGTVKVQLIERPEGLDTVMAGERNAPGAVDDGKIIKDAGFLEAIGKVLGPQKNGGTV